MNIYLLAGFHSCLAGGWRGRGDTAVTAAGLAVSPRPQVAAEGVVWAHVRKPSHHGVSAGVGADPQPNTWCRRPRVLAQSSCRARHVSQSLFLKPYNQSQKIITGLRASAY